MNEPVRVCVFGATSCSFLFACPLQCCGYSCRRNTHKQILLVGNNYEYDHSATREGVHSLKKKGLTIIYCSNTAQQKNSAWKRNPSAALGFPHVCNQAGRREDPCSSWLWEQNINLLPGKLSGKGLVSRRRRHWCVLIVSFFHPGSSVGGSTVTANEKGICSRKDACRPSWS